MTNTEQQAISGERSAVLRYSAFDADGEEGNPAGVVLDAQGMDDTRMQQIAAEVGFAEAAFLTGAGRLLDGPAVEACGLEHVGGIEDVRRDGFVGVDVRCGGGVGIQAERFASQVGEDAVGRYVSCQILVEGGLLRSDGDGLARPAAPGGCDGSPLGIRLGDREEGGGGDAEVAEQFGGQPEVLARVRGQSFQSDGFLGNALAQENVGDGVGLSGEVAAVRNGAGTAGDHDQRGHSLPVQFCGAVGDADVVAAEHEQALGRLSGNA
jgi:hypothetical protein